MSATLALASTLGVGGAAAAVAAFFGVRYHLRKVSGLQEENETLRVHSTQMKRDLELANTQIHRLTDLTDSKSAAARLREANF